MTRTKNWTIFVWLFNIGQFFILIINLFYIRVPVVLLLHTQYMTKYSLSTSLLPSLHSNKGIRA